MQHLSVLKTSSTEDDIIIGFHCQASSLRTQWPLPSQALHVLANPNIPQQVSGKLQSRDWMIGCEYLLNGNSGFRVRLQTGISHIHRSNIYHPSQKQFLLK